MASSRVLRCGVACCLRSQIANGNAASPLGSACVPTGRPHAGSNSSPASPALARIFNPVETPIGHASSAPQARHAPTRCRAQRRAVHAPSAPAGASDKSEQRVCRFSSSLRSCWGSAPRCRRRRRLPPGRLSTRTVPLAPALQARCTSANACSGRGPSLRRPAWPAGWPSSRASAWSARCAPPPPCCRPCARCCCPRRCCHEQALLLLTVPALRCRRGRRAPSAACT